MIYAFIALAVAWLLALVYIAKLSRTVKAFQEAGNYWHDTAAANLRNANQLRTKLEVAEKQLVDLEGQTPGRDKTGRFVKREKVSVEKV